MAACAGVSEQLGGWGGGAEAQSRRIEAERRLGPRRLHLTVTERGPPQSRVVAGPAAPLVATNEAPSPGRTAKQRKTSQQKQKQRQQLPAAAAAPAPGAAPATALTDTMFSADTISSRPAEPSVPAAPSYRCKLLVRSCAASGGGAAAASADAKGKVDRCDPSSYRCD
eukprot:COSAG01_NODE_898_length_12870_cov_27.573800_5_plen_168_part_00